RSEPPGRPGCPAPGRSAADGSAARDRASPPDGTAADGPPAGGTATRPRSRRARASGAVVTSGYETRYGRVVKVEHGNGFMTAHATNDENMVEAGGRVVSGQVIASVGRTGRATSHHVHFEIRHAGLAYNPLYMLPLPPRLTQLVEPEDEEPDEADE